MYTSHNPERGCGAGKVLFGVCFHLAFRALQVRAEGPVRPFEPFAAEVTMRSRIPEEVPPKPFLTSRQPA